MSCCRPLTRAELGQAVRRYARRHGYSASTVRTVTSLRNAAVAEWMARAAVAEWRVR